MSADAYELASGSSGSAGDRRVLRQQVSQGGFAPAANAPAEQIAGPMSGWAAEGGWMQ
jgi:hypothetical protein